MTDERHDTHPTDPLARLLTESPVPDEGFTSAVMAPLARRRHRRRVALSAGWSVAALLTVGAAPGAGAGWTGLDVQMLAASMMLGAVSGAVWIATAE